jgi:hypothetical protein
MKPKLLALVAIVVVLVCMLWAPNLAQAQSTQSVQPQTIQYPVYYRGYYPAYGWNPYWGYPYAVNPGYYYMPPTYSYYWTPGYTLPPYQQRAYGYWARTTYYPYYSYYGMYRPAYYYYGY